RRQLSVFVERDRALEGELEEARVVHHPRLERDDRAARRPCLVAIETEDEAGLAAYLADARLEARDVSLAHVGERDGAAREPVVRAVRPEDAPLAREHDADL